MWSASAQMLSHVRLCDPMEGSPQDSSVPEILPARILKWISISSSVISEALMLGFPEGFWANFLKVYIHRQ